MDLGSLNQDWLAGFEDNSLASPFTTPSSLVRLGNTKSPNQRYKYPIRCYVGHRLMAGALSRANTLRRIARFASFDLRTLNGVSLYSYQWLLMCTGLPG